MNTKPNSPKSFDVFFKDDIYIKLKNNLYNYLIRKERISTRLENDKIDMLLEAGSGISPISNIANIGKNAVYSDITYSAMASLKEKYPDCNYVVADLQTPPFKQDSFSHIVCSEVLEHIDDDQKAINELSRALKKNGELIITVPHNKFYFALDDRFVGHLRRYSIHEIISKLTNAQLKITSTEKILGPLDKLTMIFAVFFYSKTERLLKTRNRLNIDFFSRFTVYLFKIANLVLSWLIKLDTLITPIKFSSAILVTAKKPSQKGD